MHAQVRGVKGLSPLIMAQGSVICGHSRQRELFHSVNKYLLNIHYVPGPVLDPG